MKITEEKKEDIINNYNILKKEGKLTSVYSDIYISKFNDLCEKYNPVGELN